jgi:hypothetical protein
VKYYHQISTLRYSFITVARVWIQIREHYLIGKQACQVALEIDKSPSMVMQINKRLLLKIFLGTRTSFYTGSRSQSWVTLFHSSLSTQLLGRRLLKAEDISLHAYHLCAWCDLPQPCPQASTHQAPKSVAYLMTAAILHKVLSFPPSKVPRRDLICPSAFFSMTSQYTSFDAGHF